MNYLFTSERLQVRRLKEDDIVAFHKMHANPKVMQYTGDNPKTLDEDHADLSHVIACYDKPDNDFWVWAVERKSDGKLMGTCALLKTKVDPPNEAEDEIGYRFLEEYWGNGYASEIATELMRYAFTHFNLNELVAEVDELNKASVRILEKQMTFEKAYYSDYYKSNDRKYRISKADFFAK